MISWLQVYLSLIYGSDFQQLLYVDLHMLAGGVIASNKLRPKLIANISLGSCRENSALMNYVFVQVVKARAGKIIL